MSTPPPLGPYVPVVRAGDWLIVSGQVGMADGVLADGVAAQTTQAIAQHRRPPRQRTARDLTDVAKTLCFLVDMGDFATFNEAYVGGFGDHRPARSTIGVAALPVGAIGRDRGVGVPAGVTRCAWADGDELMRTYHDVEWGVPAARRVATLRVPRVRGRPGRALVADRAQQARPRTARSSPSFDVDTVAAFDAPDVARLLGDAGIIRNRAKIEATIGNARAVQGCPSVARRVRVGVRRRSARPEPLGGAR